MGKYFIKKCMTWSGYERNTFAVACKYIPLFHFSFAMFLVMVLGEKFLGLRVTTQFLWNLDLLGADSLRVPWEQGWYPAMKLGKVLKSDLQVFLIGSQKDPAGSLENFTCWTCFCSQGSEHHISYWLWLEEEQALKQRNQFSPSLQLPLLLPRIGVACFKLKSSQCWDVLGSFALWACAFCQTRIHPAWMALGKEVLKCLSSLQCCVCLLKWVCLGHCHVFAVCFLFSGIISHHKNQKSLKIGEMCLREEKDVGGEAGGAESLTGITGLADVGVPDGWGGDSRAWELLPVLCKTCHF